MRSRLSQAVGHANKGSALRILPLLKRVLCTFGANPQNPPPRTPIELWWQNGVRLGQQTKLMGRWAKQGTQPSASKDQHRASALDLRCNGKETGIILPRCNSEAMSLHLAETAFHVTPGAHAAVIIDHAGVTWLYLTGRARQYHPHKAAAPMSRTETCRKCLVVHARQLALQPHL